MSKKLKIGIVGCGGIANQKHFPALATQKNRVEIVGLCDIIIERAEKAKKEYGTDNTKVYEDYHELLKDDSIDIIYVLTPNVSHSPITVAAFRANKHVLCEKPMAHNTEAAKDMLDAWKKTDRKFTIGYQNRFRSEVQALYKSCQNGDLGDIYYAKAHAVRRRAVPTWGVFPNKALQGGGPLIDIGTHALDLTLWMMNNYEPESVLGTVFYKMADQFEGNMFGPWDPKTFEVEDSAMGLIKFKNGSTVYIEAAWAINLIDSKEAATTLCGTLAGAEIKAGMSYESNELLYNFAKNGLLMEEKNSSGGAIAYFDGKKKDPGVLECENWLDAVEHNKEPLVNPNQAFIVTKILDAIYLSAKENKEIKL